MGEKMKTTLNCVSALLLLAVAILAVGTYQLSPWRLTVYACASDRPVLRAVAFAILRTKSFDPNQLDGVGASAASPLGLSLAVLMNAPTEHDRDDAKKVVDWLLSRGGDLNRPAPPEGWTPLHDAVSLGPWSEPYMRYLLSKGADPNAKAGSGHFAGRTPLAFAYEIQRAAFKNKSNNPNYDPKYFARPIQILKEAHAHE